MGSEAVQWGLVGGTMGGTGPAQWQEDQVRVREGQDEG